MHLGPRLLTALLGLVLTVTLAPPAQAQEQVPATLTLTGTRAAADAQTLLALDLVREDGTPVAGAQVLLERRVDGAWQQLGPVVTDEQGHAETTATMRRDAADNVFRASYAGDPTTAPARSGAVEVRLLRRNGRVTLAGPDQVVDEQTVTLTARWRTGSGTPVPGRVQLQRRVGDDWKVVEHLRTGQDGEAQVTLKPREDTRWRVVAKRLDWVTGDRSAALAIDNVPPGIPVNLPAGAPSPRIKLPDQPYAVGEGPNARISRIPNGIWNHMTGRSYRAGCPVGRASLRLLRINYWNYAGYRRRGELVAHADAIGQMAGALADMYRAKLPIRAMYRVDRFGYSARVRGADDYKSMAAGNTSAFNCRQVVGNPSARSPHSWGRSLDVNTWENPYRSRQGTVPNTWWMGHSHPRVAWRSRDHRVVQIMARHGLRWTYGNGDTQHFDAPAGNGRIRTALRYCDGCAASR